MEISQDPPKKIMYSLRLYNHLGNGGLFRKMSRKMTGKIKKLTKTSQTKADFKEQIGNTAKISSKRPDLYYSKAELKDFLHHENSTSANDYLKELEKEKILQETELWVEKENGEQVKAWKLEKEELGKLIETLDYMQPHKQFFRDRDYGRPERT